MVLPRPVLWNLQFDPWFLVKSTCCWHVLPLFMVKCVCPTCFCWNEWNESCFIWLNHKSWPRGLGFGKRQITLSFAKSHDSLVKSEDSILKNAIPSFCSCLNHHLFLVELICLTVKSCKNHPCFIGETPQPILPRWNSTTASKASSFWSIRRVPVPPLPGKNVGKMLGKPLII